MELVPISTITFSDVVKRYGEETAVKDVNLQVREGEFLVLVGPSGCGKTSTLRMIAGLESVTEGTIELDGEVINDLAPKDRDVSMVFQDYAIYPHKNVYDNIAFGLQIRGESGDEIDEKVHNAAQILGIEELLDRKPNQLSGGQRQRVALGRSIVRDPKAFLLDEPLANLDAKLRVDMRAELIELHKNLQTTVVYVTHDQTEAMTMGDRIGVMKDGVLQQVDGPMEVYDNPANMFVAGFLGSPAMNFIPATLRKNGDYHIEGDEYTLGRLPDVDPETESRLESYVDGDVILGVRPEAVFDVDHIEDYADKQLEIFEAQIDVHEPMGDEIILYITGNDGQEIIMNVDSTNPRNTGESLQVAFDPARIHLFDPDTEERIS